MDERMEDLNRWIQKEMADSTSSFDPEIDPNSLRTSDDLESAFGGFITSARHRRLIAITAESPDVYELPTSVPAAVQALQEITGRPGYLHAIREESMPRFIAEAERRGIRIVDKTKVPEPEPA